MMVGSAVDFLVLIALPFVAGYSLRAYISRRRQQRFDRRQPDRPDAPVIANDLVPDPREAPERPSRREPMVWP